MSPFLRSLYEFFIGHDPELTPVEMAFLHFIRDHLPEPDHTTMSRQLACIRGIQRSAGGRYGILAMRRGTPTFSDLASRNIAEVTFRVKRRRHRLQLYARKGVSAILETRCRLSDVVVDDLELLEVHLEPKTSLNVDKALDRFEHGPDNASSE